MSRARALIVAYAFPPTGGVGVTRMVKLCKYVGGFDVDPTVFTVENPSVPLHDQSFARDLPEGMKIVRSRTLEPGFGVKQVAWRKRAGKRQSRLRRLLGGAVSLGGAIMVPDPQLLWQPAAATALGRRLARGEDDVVLISGPPFSQFLLAPLVRIRPGVAVVLDYRDEWSTLRTSYEMIAGRVTGLVGEAMETLVLRCAHYVTTATDAFREHLLSRYDFLDPDRVVTIPNGYDREDMPEDVPELATDKLVITYAGTVFKLTSVRGFLEAIRHLHQTAPEVAQHLEVRFYGRVVETETDAFEGMEELGVRQFGFLPHDEVIAKVAASDIALCVLDDVPDVERILPAKIFELMVMSRHILTLAPPGELSDLVERHRLGTVLPPRDELAIAAHLRRLVEDWRRGELTTPLPPIGIERYDRRVVAERFAEVMHLAIARARK